MRTRIAGSLAALAGLAAAGVTHAQAPSAPEPEKLRLAHDVMEAVGGVSNMQSMIRALVDGMIAQLPQARTTAEQAKLDQVLSYMKQRMSVYVPQMVADTEAIYVKEFTSEQLRDILVFYRSPTGQVMAQKLPVITREAVNASRPLAVKLQRDLVAKACTLTICNDQQKALLARLQQAAAD